MAGLSVNPASSFNDFATQSFDVYSGTGSTAADVGSITTGEDVTDLLGFTNTQLVVTGATVSGDGTASDLPTVGSVYARSTWATDMRTSTPQSRAPTADPTPSPTRW